MERTSFARMACPIARAVDEIADGWGLLLLREAYKGAATFSELEKALGIVPTTLTRKLEALTERGLFAKRTYQDNPPRERYELTEKALDLLPVLVALGAWGNRWLGPVGEPRTFVDAATGKPMDVAVIDRRTSQPVVPGRVALKSGSRASTTVLGAAGHHVSLKGELSWASSKGKSLSSRAATAALASRRPGGSPPKARASSSPAAARPSSTRPPPSSGRA